MKRTQLIPMLMFTAALILVGMGWLSFGYHRPLDRNPWSVFTATLVLTLTTLGVMALRRLARRRGFTRLGLALAVIAVLAVIWALPALVSPCSPIVAAVSAGSAQCSQCCTWWEPAPCSLCSAADQAAGKCKGCCFAYEPCNCVTPPPDPDANPYANLYLDAYQYIYANLYADSYRHGHTDTYAASAGSYRNPVLLTLG